MHGHTHLMAMRKEGFKPVLTFVDVDRSGSVDDWLNATIPDTAHVWIEPADPVDRLDLRCFIGLAVSISGTEHGRVDAIAGAIQRAGAKRVVSSHMRAVGDGEYLRYEIERVNDTTGVMTWPD